MKIVHLPNGRWRFERDDGKDHSDTFPYESTGYWIHGPYLFVGQTEYYGQEKIIMAMQPQQIPYESVDRTLS